MKKIIIAIFMISLSLISKAQTDTLTINQRLLFAGAEAEKYEHYKKTCFFISISGIVAAGIGFIPITTNYKENYGYSQVERSRTEPNQTIIVSGISIAVLGYVLNQVGNNHMRKMAGYLSSNGISIPLRKISPIYFTK